MRLVNLDNIKEGMILGRSIYGPNTELFLRKGMMMKDAYVTSLRRLNYHSIYIEDELSQDIKINEAITSEQRNIAVRAVKNVFKNSISGNNSRMQFSGLYEAVSGIIDQILSNEGAIDNLTTLKSFDEYTFQHSVNACIISVLMGKKLRFSKNSLMNLGIASILHDIGKIAVPYEIINKPSTLTNEEYDLVKEHPRLGRDMVIESKIFPPEVALAIYQHHERPDGRGYLENKSNEELHIYAKIIALADVYDAITSKRSYKNAMPTFEAYECIMTGMGTQFDSEITAVFLKNIAPFPVGTVVQLSNGQTGIVINNNENLMMRPCIRLAENKEILDLSDAGTLSVTITGIIE
jgi:HD-GYP domain-containing protein (c-di-GMP phosphodiesterase class II)